MLKHNLRGAVADDDHARHGQDAEKSQTEDQLGGVDGHSVTAGWRCWID